MNSSKTAQLIMVAHNYRSQGKNVLVLKPDTDVRSETVYSRAIQSISVDKLVSPDKPIFVHEPGRVFNEIHDNRIHCILVDECQWLSEQNVDELRQAASIVPVICYGLKTDYKSKLFTGSKRLLEISDSIEEIKNICVECDKKAIINAKFYVNENGFKVVIEEGSSEPDFGAEEKYQAMCWKCWRSG
jgi:thymidine kinase